MVSQVGVRWPMGAPPSADWFVLVDAVRSWGPDLIVAVARKMPRLDEALDLNLSSVATTISDLAIPFSAPFVRGARVAVLDDSVNVGSTMRHAAEALRALGASEVRAFALYSRDRREVELADDITPLTLVADEPFNHRLWREVASQAPMLISRLNKPYDLDFPVIPCDVALPFSNPDDLFAYLEATYPGRAFDVTTGVGRELGLHRFAVDLGRPGEVFEKVRFYYDATTCALNFVPMRIQAPLPIEPDVDGPAWAREIFDQLVAAAVDGPEVRARALLFTSSLGFGLEVLGTLCEVVAPSNPHLVDLREAELIFGPTARNFTLTCDLVDSTVEPLVGSQPSTVAKFDESDAVFSSSPAWEHVWPVIADEVAEAGTDPIVRAVAVFEALSREVGSESVKEYSLAWPRSSEEVEQDPYQRLRIGFTASDLCRILSVGAQTARSAAGWLRTTSKVLDRLIDTGMVVPTIATYEGKLYRVYRKGEADPRDETIDRLLLALDEYGNPMSRTRMSKVGVITALTVPTSSSVHVSTMARGNVLAIDGDLLDDDAEVFGFLLRTKKIVRQVDSEGE